MKYLIVVLMVMITFQNSLFSTETTDYWDWLEQVTVNSLDAYVLTKKTITCKTHKKYAIAYNSIVGTGGLYTESEVRNTYNCRYLPGFTVARIVKTKKGSTIVQIEYKNPLHLSVATGYINFDQMIHIRDYFDKFVK